MATDKNPPRRTEGAPSLVLAHAALEAAAGLKLEEAVAALAEARVQLDAALDEAMAQALLAGRSLRAVAADAGVAPNTVPPRVARTAALGSYRGPDDRVTAEGVTRARYDVEQGKHVSATPDATTPLRFRRRT
ncbi:hypothetical protein [Oerskovia jenensis]|uniref:hypothetical protein n=1 Tax=Oerskovia jenensis TaxID=162169 RepID=UPI0036DCCE3F